MSQGIGHCLSCPVIWIFGEEVCGLCSSELVPLCHAKDPHRSRLPHREPKFADLYWLAGRIHGQISTIESYKVQAQELLFLLPKEPEHQFRLYHEDVDENSRLILSGIGEKKSNTVLKLAVGLLFGKIGGLFFHTHVAGLLKIQFLSRHAVACIDSEEVV